MKIVKREAVYIPIKDISPKLVTSIKEDMTYNFFAKEKVCEECEWYAERLNDVCESCANFKGQYQLASTVKVKANRYLKVPRGSFNKVRAKLEHHHIDFKVVNKSPVREIKPFRFLGDFRNGQDIAVAAMVKKKRGVLKAPPRSGKCVVGSTLVITEDGAVPISSLFEDFVLNASGETFIGVNLDIASVNGTKAVSNLYSKVVDTTVKFVTRDGYELRGTENHRVLVARPGFEQKWVRLDELVQGDYVAVSRRVQWLGTGRDLLPYDNAAKFSYEHQFKIPAKLTTQLARLLGYWVANGCLSVNNRVSFFTENKEVMQDFVECFKHVFPDVPYAKHNSEKRTPSIVVAKSAFKRFLAEACDLGMHKAAGKYIPSVIMRGDIRFVKEFLSAYVSCDSWVHNSGLQLCSASHRLIRELQMVLNCLGVLSRYSSNKAHATNGSGIVRRYHNLNLHNTQANILLDSITLRKENRLGVESINQHDQIPYIRETLRELTRRFAAPGYNANGPFLVNGRVYPRTRNRVLVFNNRRGLVKGGPVNRNFLPKVNQEVLRWLDADLADKFIKFTDDRVSYQEVVSVKTINKPVRVYDVEVPDGRHYIANGIVSHNTVMGTALSAKLKVKTLILASQRDWLLGFQETYIGSKTQKPLTNLNPKRIKLCKTLDDFRKHDVCLATVQTFYSEKGERMLAKLRDEFGLVMIDEAHTSAADKYAVIASRLNCEYMIGFSGTPERKDQKDILVENIVGPVIYEMKTERVRPRVKLTRTGYAPPKRSGRGTTPWAYIVSNMENDKKRIDRIAKQAIKDVADGHMVLIPVAQVKPIKMVVARINKLTNKTLAYEFTGSLKKNLRDEYIQKARDYKIKILVGTQKILSVGINIPRASMLYEVCMSANLPNCTQRLARVCTPHEDKPDPVVRYFLDDFSVRKNCLRQEFWQVMMPVFKPIIDEQTMTMMKAYLSGAKTNTQRFDL